MRVSASAMASLRSAVAFLALGIVFLASRPASAAPPLPDGCRQSNPAASFDCEFATLHPPGYLAPDVTGDPRCVQAGLPPSVPPYGTHNLGSETAAIARIESNWDCYLTVVLGACDVGGPIFGGVWWYLPGPTPYADLSVLGERDILPLQRSVRKPFKLMKDGVCATDAEHATTVDRIRPTTCQPGWHWQAMTLSDGQTYHICSQPTPTCEDGRCSTKSLGYRHGNPVDITAGSKHLAETDFRGGGKAALVLERRYNSSIVPETAWTRRFRSVGHSWRTNFDRRLVTYPGPANKTGVRIYRPDGSSFFYLV